MAASLATHWPPAGLRITEHDLTLRPVAEGDYVELIDAARSGIHAEDAMPFSVPWTLEAPEAVPANLVRYFASCVAGFRPEKFDLLLTVRLAGTVLGLQALHTEDFAVTRTGETGSWLRRDAQGRGIGTRMRRAVCAFAFDELGAAEVTSAAFLDNPASLAVSRKVGYQENGVVRLKRRTDELALNQRLVLTPQTFVRGAPIEVRGAAELRAFLGL